MSSTVAEPLSLERLVEGFGCQRLPWWRAQGLAEARQEEHPPRPWPLLPPGWGRGGVGEAHALLEGEGGLWARCDWIVRGGTHCHLILLGEPTPTLKLKLRLLGALWQAEHGEKPLLWCQPLCGAPAAWCAQWPSVLRVCGEPVGVGLLQAKVREIRAILERPWPPEGTAPLGRCWDCPGFCFCGDRG